VVRIHPEEPSSFENSLTLPGRRTAFGARCPFVALSPLGDGCTGASNRLTSADRYAGDRCAYRITMRRPRCPRSSATDRSEAPFMMSHDAKVCRRSCQVKSLMSAISSAV
jgi:hypothetical protein